MSDTRIFSFGGGVQSVACLVLAAQGRINFKRFVFSNVGDKAEHPATIEYMRNVARPYAEQHGIEMIEVYKKSRSGDKVDMYEKLLSSARSIDIPIRMSNGAPGRRSCTIDYKIKPVAAYHKSIGATKDKPGVLGIGISMDEFQRMRSSSMIPWQILEYPLIDLRLSRADCKTIIAEAGLPVPPKSSCWFCPFHTIKAWRDLAKETPELFNKAADLEKTLNDRRVMLGRDKAWFSGALVPLPVAVGDLSIEQLGLFEEEHSCGPYVCSTIDRPPS